MTVVIFLLAWMLKNDVPDFPIPIAKGLQALATRIKTRNHIIEVA